MSTELGIVDYVVICMILVIPAGIGIYFRFSGGRQKTVLEFLMADKNMSVLPVTFSVLATILSAVSYLGIPAEVYTHGAHFFMKEIAFALAIAIVAYWIIPVYFEINANSIFMYLEKRFGKVIKTAISVFFNIQTLLYMTIVVYAPSLALSTLTGLSVWTSVTSIAVVCTFYSTLGGLKAVLWTDLFQAFLMILTVFILIIKGVVDVGGFHKVFEVAEKGQRLHIINTSTDFTVRYTLWNTISHGFVMSLFFHGANFSVVQRLLSCGDVAKAQRSLLWNIPIYLLFEFGVCFLGIIMYSYYHECDPIQNKEITSGDQLVILFILKSFGHIPGLPGLCVAGIFSAALSTMSSMINSLAAMTLEDFIKPYTNCTRLKETTTTLIVKATVVFYGFLCLLLTLIISNAKGVIEAAIIILGIIGAPTVAVFCLGMFTSTANEAGVVIGFITGFAINAWCGFGALYNRYKYPSVALSTAGCALNTSIHVNGIYKVNSTMDMDITNFTETLLVSNGDERYIFPLYKISYLWPAVISFVTTIILGYVTSYIKGLWKKESEINANLFSPVVRKWLQKTSMPKERCDYIILKKSIMEEIEVPLDTVLNEEERKLHEPS